MEKNKDILNEAFFGKSKLFMSKKNAEKLNKGLPQYTPISPDKISNTGFTSVMNLDPKKGIEFDTKEVKKRLGDAIGAVFGINNVKSLADRAVKKFPIILSDDIEPETAVSLKRLMEEQYAEYINLLIGNQILDVSEFTTDKGGNIAIQALDRITGADEKVSIGNKAMSGEFNVEDILSKDIFFNMLREDKQYKSGDEALDYFLENAIVFDNNEDVKTFISYLTEEFQRGDLFTLGLEYSSLGPSGSNDMRYIITGEGAIDEARFSDDSLAYIRSITPMIVGIGNDKTFIYMGLPLSKDLEFNEKNFITPEEKEYLKLAKKIKTTLYIKNTYNSFESNNRIKSSIQKEIPNLNKILNNNFIPDLISYNPHGKDTYVYEFYGIKNKVEVIDMDLRQKMDSSPERRDELAITAAKKYNIKVIKVLDKFKERSAIEVTGNETSYPDEKKYPSVVLYDPEDKEDEKDEIVDEIINSFKETIPSIQGNKFSVRSLANEDALINSLDATIGELINKEENKIIKDKFAKAQLLLIGNRITGKEFIEFVTVRLGMPIPEKVRRDILIKFPISKLDAFEFQIEKSKGKYILNKEIQSRIEKSQHLFYDGLYANMFKPTLKEVFNKVLKVGGISLGAGVVGTLSAIIAGAPIFAPISALILGTTAAVIAAKKIKLRTSQTMHSNVRGWERVEALISELERQRNEVIKVEIEKKDLSGSIKGIDGKDLEIPLDSYDRSLSNYEKLMKARLQNEKQDDKEIPMTQSDIDKVIEAITKEISKYKKPSGVKNESVGVEDELYVHIPSEDEIIEIQNELDELRSNEEDETDKFVSNLLKEAVIETNIPSKVYKYEIKTDDKSKVMIAPAYTARSSYAYGSTEYDRRENKDRKYNQPLILTVTFKERFSDGKFSDNELTAVIGILGVITRVPSEEMEYVLKTSAEGTTLKGIFQGDGTPANLISDLLQNSKINQKIKNLPVSSDIWRGLESIKAQAIANSVSGKKTENVANAHIVFSQKEVDNVRSMEGHDYIKNRKLPAKLMDKYSAFTLMIANDLNERLYIFDDPNRASWDVVPYSAIRGKDSGEQLTATLSKLSRGNF